MKYLSILLLLPLLAAAAPASETDSVWTEGKPLQVKFDRLYLGCGVEERVYPNCRFVVHHGSDLIYTGCIDQSYPGVAVSSPTSGFFDTLRLADLHVWMERAPVDTVNAITIGYADYLPTSSLPSATSVLAAHMNGDSLRLDTARIMLRRYESTFEMSLAFDNRTLDGYFSYRKVAPGGNDISTIGQPAPFFVALVPNVARNVTRDGFLTTSLYYRLDPQRLPMYFNGDEILPLNRATVDGALAPRPFPYSPEVGKQLVQRIRGSARTVAIWVEHPLLEPAAGYFADILARDRFRATITTEHADADVRLVLIPLVENPVVNLRQIYRLLVADTVRGLPVNQTLRIIGGYLDEAALSPEPSSRDNYLALAEQSLRDDIGVFPLFRPSLFFTSRQGLLGHAFGPHGEIELDRLSKVRIPTGRSECEQ